MRETPAHSPLVSILLPVFNEASNIRKCLDSCLALSYQNIEVIVSDNASTDDTWSIVQSYVVRDARVIAHRFDCEQHVIDNLYRCVESARGELVFHGGGDDYFKSPNFLDPIVKEFADTRLAGYLSRLEYFDDVSGRSLYLLPPNKFELFFSQPRVEFVRSYLTYCSHDEPLVAVYRRELLLEAMGKIRHSGLESPGWWIVLHMYFSAVNRGWRYKFDRESQSVLMKRINKASSAVFGVQSSAGINISKRDSPAMRVANSIRYARIVSELVPARAERLLIRRLLLFGIRRKTDNERRFLGAGWSALVGKKLFGKYTGIHKDNGLGRVIIKSLRRRLRERTAFLHRLPRRNP